MTARGDNTSYRMRYLRLRSALEDRNTELPACGAVIDRLRTMADGVHRLGVVMIEIAEVDVLESIYGWQLFDEVSREVARALRAELGRALPRDAVLAIDRVAGDRFLVFVSSGDGGERIGTDDLRGMCVAAVEALARVATDGSLSSVGPRLTFRAGFSIVTPSPFRRFERSVYAAVREAAAMPSDVDARRRRASDHDLDRILRDADVRTVFHAVVDLESRDEVGWEALSRGPRGTMFESPASLFAASDSRGLGPELDRVCRDAALRRCGTLDRDGLVFVNVLAESLVRGDWTGTEVCGLLESASRTPGGVVLEVSERGIASDLAPVASAVEGLREVGFRFAVDDVGTGFGSVDALETLRPDFVKVDGSLVREVDAHGIKRRALSSVVRIARDLGADVIAEGVETEGEASAVRGLGVRYAQGYLFSTPVDAQGPREDAP